MFNAHLWSIAVRQGAVVLDQWGAAWIQDARLWDAGDRIHLTAEGHRRTALAAAAALGVPIAGDDTDWRAPLEPAPAPPTREGVVAQELAWVRGSCCPGSVGGCAGGPPGTAGPPSARSPSW